jgi:hypothetical protein
MGKSIVVCFDGTWNEPNDKTNVWKLYSRLAGEDAAGVEQDYTHDRVLREAGLVVQLARYFTGVGGSKDYFEQALGGGIGVGLIARIVDAYAYLSQNYDPGDDICIFGFSRGAYEARALTGMIAAQGVIDRNRIDLNDQEGARKYAFAAWASYRQHTTIQSDALAAAHVERGSGPLPLLTIAATLRSLLQEAPAVEAKPAEVLDDTTQMMEFGFPVPRSVQLTHHQLLTFGTLFPPDGLEENQFAKVRHIKAVGVWDTVGSYGVPAYAFRDGARADLFKFANNKLSPIVEVGLHAIAASEQRADMTPSYWEPAPNVLQVLFAGEHSDVGGGWDDESGLSDCSLAWMMKKLRELGTLRFAHPPGSEPSPNPLACGHASHLRGLWRLLPSGLRKLPSGLRLHQSLVRRIGQVVFDGSSDAPVLYRPQNLVAAGYLQEDFLVNPGVAIEQ